MADQSSAVRYRGRYDLDTKELRYQLKQNVGPLLKHTKFLRDTEHLRKDQEYQHICSLTEIECNHIQDKYHINPRNMKREDWPLLLRVVQREYPLLMTTNKKISL